MSYKEDVRQLKEHLLSSGMNPQIYRASYSQEELSYSAVTRCLLSHRAAWNIASQQSGFTLICEADFVPCANIGSLPTFWPLEKILAWGYLYQGSPRILAIIGEQGYIRGHCAPLVAYVINSEVANILLRFFEYEMGQYDPTTYFAFDAHLQWWLMGQGAEAYIPLKHYGEHGGSPNSEHAKMGKILRAGKHRADNLAGPLAFLPAYANGSRLLCLRERIEARALGWGRLITRRWFIATNGYSPTRREGLKMQWLGIRRLLV